ncbi:MAG: anthranilate synthase component I family protein, partial [Halioglobus sp.]|nr:anthranilate synthase component I family protein [Halioglobus sp.]
MKKSLHLEDIPYCPDSCELFERIRDLPFPAFLDSAYPHATTGRYDILTAMPAEQSLPSLARSSTEQDARALFGEWEAFHRDYFQDIQGAYPDLPFCGGLLGQLAYGCGMALEGIQPDAGDQPLASLRAYDWCVVQDHLLQRAVLVCQPRVHATQRADLLRRLRLPVRGDTRSFALSGKFTAGIDEEGYRRAFDRIQAYIQAGDCYQVNLAQRFSSSYAGDPWHAYRVLRAVAAAPFSAYLEDENDSAVLSLSPERFLSLHGHHVETSPIKGTRPRYADASADRLAAEELRGSAKDRAENLMIVDLLRNDLGRNCKPGSIHVDRLFDVQSFPTVHHLV